MKIRRIFRGIFHFASYIIAKIFYKNDYAYENVKNIIIFRPDNLGDFILSIPAIYSIKGKFPSAKITCVVHNDSAEVAKRLCDKVIIYDSPFVHSKGLESKINFIYIFNKLHELQQIKYDLIIDLRSDLLTLMYALFNKSRYRIDASSQRIKPVLSKTINILLFKPIIRQKSIHELDFNSTVLEKNKIPVCRNIDKSFFFSSDDIAYVKKLLSIENLSDYPPFAILHPGASWAHRRWSMDKYAELTDVLIEKFNISVIFVGSEGEAYLIDTIISNMKTKKNFFNLAGKTSVIQLMNLCKMTSLVVCNDSAVGHIASFAETKVISLFGAQDPKIFGPKGDNVYIIKKDLYCSPCAQIKCMQPEGKRCMDLITVDDVVSVINKIFEKDRKE